MRETVEEIEGRQKKEREVKTDISIEQKKVWRHKEREERSNRWRN